MAQLHVLRVFTGEGGAWGNPLGVFLDGGQVPEERRQEVAADLGFSETVFVDDRAAARCRIFTPGLELPFAGHPMVGTAWLLEREGDSPQVLRPPAGEVAVRGEAGLTYVAARAEWSPRWELLELDDPAAVDAVVGSPQGVELAYYWAWEGKGRGQGLGSPAREAPGEVRARCFSLEDGVGEDEATGSAAIMLSAGLERSLTIHQGRGSVLRARFLGDGRAEVGGTVVLDELREYRLA